MRGFHAFPRRCLRPRRGKRRRAGADAAAPAWPTKPIRMIVTFPPGGSPTRRCASSRPSSARRLGQQVVVDNRPGAGGNIGLRRSPRPTPTATRSASARPAASAANAALYPKMPFDAQKDFVPISLLAHIPFVLVVHAGVADEERRRPGRAGQGRAGQGRGRPRRQRHGDAPVGAAVQADGGGRPHRGRRTRARARSRSTSSAARCRRHARPAVGAAADQGRQGARLAVTGARGCRSCPRCRRSPRRRARATSRPAGSASSRRRRRRRPIVARLQAEMRAVLTDPEVIAGARAAGRRARARRPRPSSAASSPARP